MLGSACGLGLDILYHKRQLARKAGQSRYSSVPSAATGDVEMGQEQVPTDEPNDSGIREGDAGVDK